MQGGGAGYAPAGRRRRRGGSSPPRPLPHEEGKISRIRLDTEDRLEREGAEILRREPRGRDRFLARRDTLLVDPLDSPERKRAAQLSERLLWDVGAFEGVPGYLSLSYEDVLETLAADPQLAPWAAPYQERAWRHVQKRDDRARRAKAFLQNTAEILNPGPLPRGRGQPSELAPHRVKIIYRWNLDHGRRIQRDHADSSIESIGPEFLPVIDLPGDERITIGQRSWPSAFALVVTAHRLDMGVGTLRDYVRGKKHASK
jgi:hypothetical protein